ncbi:hypothetical protein HKX48_008965 [Thoreauomyces humboldtii]|nr:hypothetical protein HKX48_008965 [Thoreauomyces humboldtii]
MLSSVYSRSLIRPRSSLCIATRTQLARFSTEDAPALAPASPDYTPGERTLHEKLANQLQASKLTVSDISGGCGSMFAIQIASPMFRGVSLVKQHRMVTDLLQEDIKGMHGIQIKTEAS